MPRRQLQGEVVSNKMLKTVVVKVLRIKEHPKYKKRFRTFKRYKAQANEAYEMGDKVVIEERNPISKDKKWEVIKKL